MPNSREHGLPIYELNLAEQWCVFDVLTHVGDAYTDETLKQLKQARDHYSNLGIQLALVTEQIKGKQLNTLVCQIQARFNGRLQVVLPDQSHVSRLVHSGQGGAQSKTQPYRFKVFDDSPSTWYIRRQRNGPMVP